MEKIIRGFINLVRIWCIKIKAYSRIHIYPVQPMRIKSQLIVQNKCKKVEIGKNFKLETDSKVRVINGGEFTVGDNCFINCGTYITIMGKTTIGNDGMIGPGVMIFDHDHAYAVNGGIKEGKTIIGEIRIGNNVWIGANSCILRGATIGDNSVIAAGSIVKGIIPNDTLLYQERKSVMRTITS